MGSQQVDVFKYIWKYLVKNTTSTGLTLRQTLKNLWQSEKGNSSPWSLMRWNVAGPTKLTGIKQMKWQFNIAAWSTQKEVQSIELSTKY